MPSYFFLKFGNESTQVTVLYVYANNDASLAHASINKGRSFQDFDVCQILKRNLGAIRGTHLQLPDIRNAVTRA